MGQKSSTQTDRISKDIGKGTRSFAQYHDVSIQGVLPKGERNILCALLLTVLEATYMSDYITDSIPNIFDFYGSSRHSEGDGDNPSKAS